MYQSKLLAKHNKNPLALIYLPGCGCKCVCVCCGFVRCGGAVNPLTLRVVNLPTLRRVNLFFIVMLPCRGVEP